MDDIEVKQQTSNEIHYALDKNGRVLDISDNIKDITGFGKEMIVGQNFRTFVQPEEEKSVFIHFQNAILGKYEPCDFNVNTAYGTQIRLRSNCHAPSSKIEDARIEGTLTKI